MEKPSAVAADELRQGIAYLVNNSGLPAFVVAMILVELANEAKSLSMQELKQANDEWNEYCSQEQNKHETEN